MLSYSLFVAARWQPPAVSCHGWRMSVVPSALYRLLALVTCLAYATSSLRACLDSAVVLTRDAEAPPPPRAPGTLSSDDPFVELIYSLVGWVPPLSQPEAAVTLLFHGIQLALNLLAAFVVVHRLWLQSSEDDRPWISFESTRGKAGTASPSASPAAKQHSISHSMV